MFLILQVVRDGYGSYKFGDLYLFLFTVDLLCLKYFVICIICIYYLYIAYYLFYYSL